MSAVFPQPEERARKNVGAIFTGLSATGQSKVAEALGVADSTVSKMKDKDIPEMARFLALCGLKVVPETYKCVDPGYLSAIVTLAQKHMAELNPQVLSWDE